MNSGDLMYINEYLCNMKVLIGLVLANSIGLDSKKEKDKISLDDDTNPLMEIHLSIYLKDKYIKVDMAEKPKYYSIFKEGRVYTIYGDYFITSDVFLQ